MRKIIAMLLALCLIFGLTACSGGSGIGRSGQNLADNAGSGNWLEGDRLESGISEDELKTWIEGL